MGLTWLFGFLSLESEDPALSNLSLTFNIIFILVNSLQVNNEAFDGNVLLHLQLYIIRGILYL